MGTDEERRDRFFGLALNAKRADDELRAEFSDAEYEQVLDYVAEHPGDRPRLAEAFIAIAYDPSLGPIDLVEYCMYALQWPEVRTHFIDRLEGERSERDLRCGACCKHSSPVGRMPTSIADSRNAGSNAVSVGNRFESWKWSRFFRIGIRSWSSDSTSWGSSLRRLLVGSCRTRYRR